MPAIQRLMGALCFAKRAAAGRPSPYGDVLTEDLWGGLGGCGWAAQDSRWGGWQATPCAVPTRSPRAGQALVGPGTWHFSTSLFHPHPTPPAAAREFVRQCCLLLGQAQDSPLLVSVAAGAAALPTLLKLAAVISDQVGGWVGVPAPL